MFKLSFKSQILTGFAVTLIFVFASALFSYRSIDSLIESNKWVEHTQQVIRSAEQIEIELINAETGLRGFIITEKDYYKQPYNISIDKVEPLATNLTRLVQDNPSQLKLADSVRFYALLKIADMRHIMQKADNVGFGTAKQQILTDVGRDYKLHFLRFSKIFMGNELALLKTRKLKNEKENEITIMVILSSAFVIFALVLFLLKYIRQTFDQQKETERKILSTNKELEELSAQNNYNNWLLTGADAINSALRGQQSIADLSANIATSICSYIEAPIGAIYLDHIGNQTYSLMGGYAINRNAKKQFALGEGLIGQCAEEKKPVELSDLPSTYLKISSAIGDAQPEYLYLAPIVFENKTIAVVELGFLNKPEIKKLKLLANISENIGIAFNSALAHLQLQNLFEQTQQQAEELASQQEELRTTNDELLHKSEELQASEEELRVQQEELQHANAELEEKAQLLEERNASINQAKEAISIKAEELEVSSKYKSEFLANMSHELRTPLNSILILAKILKENRPSNLNNDQIKYAGVIHNAGSDLLALINDILDLSKIESGNIDLIIENVKPSTIKTSVEQLFTEVANQKHINFKFNISDQLPKQFLTDQSRLQQILKNLLSNAFKFTPEKGNITVEMGLATPDKIFNNKALLNKTEKPIYISVIDSGIGIATEKQQVIFEAFKQEDGSTSRKYGGTGLGLSISRELATILGGEINLHSQSGFGSTFTLVVPQKIEIKNLEEPLNGATEKIAEPIKFEKDISTSNNLKKRLLIIEDDVNFAAILKDYAIEKGFEPVLAYAGDTGWQMALNEKPDAIVLDVMLPVMDGWDILKKLKSTPETKHIPVHLMSAGDVKADQAKKEGAIGFLKKPIEKDKLDDAFALLATEYQYTFNNVLVIEDQVLQSNSLTEQLITKGAKVSQAYTGQEAKAMLLNDSYDCIILDLKLPDISGFDLLDEIKSNPDLNPIPVIINTSMDLNKDQMAHIMKYSQAMVLKTNKSNDRLLDEVSLFMNKLKVNAPIYEKTAQAKADTLTIEKALKDKTILVADDDMRNIFALSSALQDYYIKVIIANNGVEALQKLEENSTIDLVLMDIMMPEMDGYEAMRNIRIQRKYANLPVIALTAKAMKNDREKCIEAGASDYISKPVDIDKLLSMLRVWLS